MRRQGCRVEKAREEKQGCGKEGKEGRSEENQEGREKACGEKGGHEIGQEGCEEGQGQQARACAAEANNRRKKGRREAESCRPKGRSCSQASSRRCARQHLLHHHSHHLSERPAAYRSRL